jgi:cytochrome c551/c552
MTRHRLTGGRQRAARWVCALLVVSGLATVVSGTMAGTAGATDASAGACISAHPPSIDTVGATSAVVAVAYKDNCAFPAQVGVKYYRPGGGFLKETRRSTQSTAGGWKTESFDLSDLPSDKLIQIQSLVENFGTDFSSTVDFTTYFTHPSSLRLDATATKGRSGADNAAVNFKVTAGGLFGQPPGSTEVTIASSVNGRALESVAAKFTGCPSQEATCTWAYTMENLPVRAKLTVSATFNNLTYAASFPNSKTTKPLGVVVGSGNNCGATTEKVLSANCAP